MKWLYGDGVGLEGSHISSEWGRGCGQKLFDLLMPFMIEIIFIDPLRLGFLGMVMIHNFGRYMV